jgi:hypothetical protein
VFQTKGNVSNQKIAVQIRVGKLKKIKIMEISTNFEIEIREKEGVWHCYIPAIDGYYFTKRKDEIQRKGSAMIQAFISFWTEQNGGQHVGAKKLFDQI